MDKVFRLSKGTCSLDLFEHAATSRDTGIAQSSKASGEDWKASAIEFVRNFLQTNATLHVDDLWEAGLEVPKSSRALGAVMQHAAREEWMEKVTTPEGYTAAKPSARSNMQLKPVWRSRLCSTATS